MVKIFVSVGTHPQAFDRLLKELDRIFGEKKIRAQVFAQTGNSSYKPKNFPSKPLLSADEFENKLSWANFVISHGGAGTIINALLYKKPLLVVPRLQKFNEHTNDHQLDLARALEKEGKVLAVFEMQDLHKKILELSSFRPKLASNKARLVKRIAGFLGEMR